MKQKVRMSKYRLKQVQMQLYINKNFKSSNVRVVVTIYSKVVCEDGEEYSAEETVSYS